MVVEITFQSTVVNTEAKRRELGHKSKEILKIPMTPVNFGTWH